MRLTFDEALDRINDQRMLGAAEVSVAALNRKVWVASNGMPGCLNDNSGVHVTKEYAVQSIVGMFRSVNDCTVPRGLITALRKDGRWNDQQGYCYRVEQITLRELL